MFDERKKVTEQKIEWLKTPCNFQVKEHFKIEKKKVASYCGILSLLNKNDAIFGSIRSAKLKKMHIHENKFNENVQK